jgi:hypothetical protein
LAFLVPSDGPAQKTRNNRADDAQENRDDDPAWIAPGHNELCQRANNQADNNHPKHFSNSFLETDCGFAIGMPWWSIDFAEGQQ